MASMVNLRGSSNTALIPIDWKKKYLKDSHEKDPLKPFYKKDSIVVTEWNLTGKKGDTIVVPIVGLPDGAGVTDDGDYDGDVGSVSVYDFPVRVHEHGRALGVNGKMSVKSPAFDARAVLIDALTQWRGMFDARAAIDALSGLKLHKLGGNVLGASGLALEGSTQIECVNQVIPAYTQGATAKRYYCGGQTSAGTLQSRVANIASLTTATNYLMGPEVVKDVRKLARKTVDASGNLINPIQPININGRMLYVMLISLEQGKAVRNSTGWKNAHYYADIRGMENSILSGQIGVIDGVMLVETDLVHQRSGANGILGPEYFDSTTVTCASGVSVHRALFLGKNAVARAMGEAQEVVPFFADNAKTKPAARVSSIYAFKKIAKNSSTTGSSSLVNDSEMGCIVVDTCVS